MSRVSTYLNFMGNTEEAFSFYGSIFATAPGDQIARMGDMPAAPACQSSPMRRSAWWPTWNCRSSRTMC